MNEARGRIVVELGRYTLVGGGAFCLDFALLYLFTEWVGLHYLLSATLAFSAGLFFNYILSTSWVFRCRACASRSKEFVIFAAIGIGGIALTNLVLLVFTPIFLGNYLAAKIVAVTLVYFWNFFLRRQLLFVAKRSAAGAD